VSDHQQGPGWWLASDGKWYPPPGWQPPQQHVYTPAPQQPDQLQQATYGVVLGCLGAIALAVALFSVLFFIGRAIGPG